MNMKRDRVPGYSERPTPIGIFKLSHRYDERIVFIMRDNFCFTTMTERFRNEIPTDFDELFEINDFYTETVEDSTMGIEVK